MQSAPVSDVDRFTQTLQGYERRIAELERASRRGIVSRAGAPSGTGTDADLYYDTTNDRLYMSDGVGWIIMYEPIQTYTPTVSNLTIGNGSLNGRYKRAAGRCSLRIQFVLGSTSAVGTNPNMSLPVASENSALNFNELDTANAMIYDATGPRYLGFTFKQGASTVALGYNVGAVGSVTLGVPTASLPMVWAVNDYFITSFEYEMGTPYL